MNYDFKEDEFSQSILAGTIAGIGATLVCLLYNFYFRGTTGFGLSEIINVSTIIFISFIVLLIAGILFYLMHHYFKQGTMWYIITTLILTTMGILLSLDVHRSPDPVLSAEFKKLLIGIVAILGIFGAFIVPYLYNSKKI